MDSQILNFLKAHNLLPIQDCFEGFDFKTFKELESEHLRLLVEKTSYRVLLEIKLKKLKDANDDEEDEKLKDANDGEYENLKDANDEEDQTTTSLNNSECSEEIVDSEEPAIIDGEVESLQNFDTEESQIDDAQVECVNVCSKLASCNNENSVLSTNISAPITTRTSALSDVIQAIDDFDMIILQNKCKKFGYIDSNDRRRLSHCIIKFQLMHSKTKILHRKTFIDTASAITKLFPKEKASVYFIPSLGKVSAKGRLYQAYKTYRDLLASAGMIEKRHMIKINIQEDDIQDEHDEADALDKSSITGVQSIEYLKTHTDPNDDINFHWSNSRQERFNMISTFDIDEYYRTFPILTMADGFGWLDLDFLQKFPNAKIGVERWSEILPKLLAYVSQKSKRNPALKTVINAYDQTDKQQMLLSFKSLPLILRNPTKSRKKKVATGTPTTRVNQMEASNGFISHFNTEADDDRTETNYIDLKVIGSKSDYNAYVYIENTNYVFDNLLLAVDCAFKLYYVFDLEFPKPSKHVWDFINLVMYDIDSKGCQAANFEVFSDIERTDV